VLLDLNVSAVNTYLPGEQLSQSSGIPRNFVLSEVQQIQLRTEGREYGDVEAVAP
jgi:hypothetical protein